MLYQEHGDHLQNTSQKILAIGFSLQIQCRCNAANFDTPAVASVIQFVPSLPHALTYVEKKMPHMGYGRCGPPRKSQWPSACNRNTRRGRNQWFRPLPHGWWLMCSHNCEQIEHHLDITWTSLGHLFIDGLVLPIHLEVLDALGCHAVRIGIVQPGTPEAVRAGSPRHRGST